MYYINNENHNYKTYDEIVGFIIANKLATYKRVYIYLAALGVKGRTARVLTNVDYLEPVKFAIKDDKYITGMRVCGDCGMPVFDTV